MKIALVSPYCRSQPGGVSEHLTHLKLELDRTGHETTVIAPRGSQGGLEIAPGFYGVGRSVPVPGNRSTVRLTLDVSLYGAVKDLLQRERFDIVHLHEPLVPVLPYMVLLNSIAVNVATFHAYRAANPWYTAFRPYMSFILGRLDARIAVSEPARDFVRTYFDGDYVVVPNGVDVDRFGTEVEPFPWALDGTPRVLFVGRFDERRKGFTDLLRAWSQVRGSIPRARLVVVGAGRPERFTRQMQHEGIENVDFCGFVPAGDLPRYYASCDVFCAPSVERESFGLILLEAMASGKPVVATAIPGYARVLTDGCEGLLVPPRDPAALAAALIRVLGDRLLADRFGRAGRVTANTYAWPRIAETVLEVYEQAKAAAAAAPWRHRLARV